MSGSTESSTCTAQESTEAMSWQLRLAISLAVGFGIVFTLTLLLIAISLAARLSCFVFGGPMCAP